MTKTIDIAKKYDLPKAPELVYTDYNDYIQDAKQLESAAAAGNYDEMFENSMDWITDAQYQGIDYLLAELKKDHPEMPEADRDAIIDYLRENDASDPIKEIVDRTPASYFYYSLGISDNGMEEEGGEPDEARVSAIMKRLRIRDLEMKKVVSEVIANAGYGGEVVILFEDKIKDLLEDGEVIEFGPKAELCIMDRFNGSGHSQALGRKVVCEFLRENLHSDEGAGGYSFTQDVCGLVRGFMDGAIIRKKKKTDKVIPAMIDEEKREAMAREKRLEEKWKKTGECTAGDMKIKRHKSTPYRNEYPCGNKCEKCGTFWID